MDRLVVRNNAVTRAYVNADTPTEPDPVRATATRITPPEISSGLDSK